jgi:signal transduction histidine kinase
MAMDLSRVRGYLIAGNEDSDVLFAGQMRRLNLLGLRIVGGTEIALGVFAFFAQLIADALKPMQPVAGLELYFGRAWQAALVVIVGLLTLAAARTRAGRDYPAFLLCFSCWFSSSALILSSLLLAPHAPDEYIAAHITTVMLVAITVAPLRPRDILLLGFSIWIFYAATFLAGLYTKTIDLAAWDISHLLFLVLLTMLATGLTAVLYDQRRANYVAHQESLRMAQFLAAAPVRALLSENAISVGRLAAALTHELNTPLGALKSSVDTMVAVGARLATSPPEAQPRLVAMQANLGRSVNECMERLKNVIARLQRFIDLHHTERRPADLNDLLDCVALELKPLINEHVALEFAFHPVPPITCRPQQLTSVFVSLLSNAINAVNGQGRILVSTEKMDALVRVRIEDNGRGMEECELETIFDPGFKVTAGRVSTGNWSLFSSRQIVFEHGGEIQISSVPGKGTTVDVLLPI